MVAALLCAATSWSSAALAAIETVVALPSLRAAAGAEVAVEVFHTNSAAEAEALSILDQLECLLETNGGSVSGALTRGGPAEREPIALAAGGFRKDVYTLRLPEGVSGVVTIELVGIAANAVMLQVGIAEQTDGGSLAVVPAVVATTQEGPDGEGAAEAAPQTGERRAESAETGVEVGDLDEVERPLYFGNFFSHEPIYFIAGDRSAGAKFQLSFKYRFFNPEAALAQRLDWIDDLYLGYSQVSLWDIYDESSPFKDTNYKPELMYFKERLTDEWGWLSQLDMQGGVRHESNGQPVERSRSINYIYIRPIFKFGNTKRYHLSVVPRAWVYVGDLSDNPDIADYRGYADLELALAKHDGAELRSLFRLGTSGKGSVQLDFNYPLSKLLFHNLAIYFYGQFFTGYGETLLTYDQKDTAFRIGLGLTR